MVERREGGLGGGWVGCQIGHGKTWMEKYNEVLLEKVEKEGLFSAGVLFFNHLSEDSVMSQTV